MIAPAHRGQVLADKLASLAILPAELVRQLHVLEIRITQIVQGKCGVIGTSALRLPHLFGDGLEFWMALQIQHQFHLAVRDSSREIRTLLRHPVQAGAR
jgi:addiction module HigA family antidote